MSKTATLTISPASVAALSSLSLNPTSVVGGNSSTGTVTLSKAAPTGGTTVALSSSKTTLANVPASVLVAAGALSANFPVTTLVTRRNASVTIVASYGGVSRSAVLAVKRR
jgi:hypothetical protein